MHLYYINTDLHYSFISTVVKLTIDLTIVFKNGPLSKPMPNLMSPLADHFPGKQPLTKKTDAQVWGCDIENSIQVVDEVVDTF